MTDSMKFFCLFFLFILFSAEAKDNFYSSRFYIGPDIFYRSYHEKIEGEAKSDEYGFLYGFQVGFEGLYKHLYLESSIRRNWGRTIYDGSLINFTDNSVEPLKSKTDNSFWNLELDFGPAIILQKWRWIPLAGMGFHNWYREATDKDDSDYDNEYSWVYLLLGTRLDYFISTKTSIGTTLKAMYTQDADVEIRNFFAFPIILRLSNQWQYSAEVFLTYCFKCDLDFRLVFYYKNQDIGESQTLQTDDIFIFEPSSTTNLFGGRLELGYRF